jgi:hypothetical protein
MPFLEMARWGGAAGKMLDVRAFFHSAPIPLLARCVNLSRDFENLQVSYRKAGGLGAQIYQPGFSPRPFMFTDSFKFAYLASRYEQKAGVAPWRA